MCNLLLLGVPSFVISLVTKRCKPPHTVTACKRFLTSMSPHMDFEISLFRECFLTARMLAFELCFRWQCVFMMLVNSQTVLSSEGFTTISTDKLSSFLSYHFCDTWCSKKISASITYIYISFNICQIFP